MKAQRIRIQDFRNLRSIELELHESANIIYGDNGQGKTNFIEAIWLFTGAKSFRGAKDAQLVGFDSPRASLQLDFTAGNREQSAQIVIEGKRKATLNEVGLKSASELAGTFCAVVFSPAHLSLVQNGPQEKRRFLDTSICQIKPKYINVLSRYNRVLEQRNRLLKDVAFEASLLDTLDIWDERFCELAAIIIKTRVTYLEKLAPYAQQAYAGISQAREQLEMHYVSSLKCDTNAPLLQIQQQLADGLRATRAQDLRARVSTCGPHRDDLELLLDQNNLRAFGSQGQQRSSVLALKMAECEMLRHTLGEYPVVLLDDVMSELDATRRDYLLNHLEGRQLIITCCDKASFDGLGRGIAIQMKNGQCGLPENAGG